MGKEVAAAGGVGGRDIFRGGWKAGTLAHPQLAGASLQCGAEGRWGAQLGSQRGLVGGREQVSPDSFALTKSGTERYPDTRFLA